MRRGVPRRRADWVGGGDVRQHDVRVVDLVAHEQVLAKACCSRKVGEASSKLQLGADGVVVFIELKVLQVLKPLGVDHHLGRPCHRAAAMCRWRSPVTKINEPVGDESPTNPPVQVMDATQRCFLRCYLC